MNELKLIDDGFGGDLVLIGNIALTQRDLRTDDFTIVAKRKGLIIKDERDMDRDKHVTYNGETDDINWLKDALNFWEVDIDGTKLHPVWKLDEFGHEPSNNYFQTNTITTAEIIITVHAGGTTDELWELGKPYKEMPQKPMDMQGLSLADILGNALSEVDDQSNDKGTK